MADVDRFRTMDEIASDFRSACQQYLAGIRDSEQLKLRINALLADVLIGKVAHQPQVQSHGKTR